MVAPKLSAGTVYFMHYSRLGRRAFTLLELIVVMVIMALLAGLAIPTFLRVIDRSKDSTAETTVSAVLRNSVALSAFDEGEKITVAMLEKAASEVSLASDEGVFAEGETFTVVEDPLPSTKYGEMSVKITDDVVGIAMLSVTGNCILGRVEGRGAPLAWTVPKGITSCVGEAGEAGPDAEPIEEVAFGAPRDLSATAGDSQVALSWTPVPTATGYRVYRDGTLLTPTVSNNFLDSTPVNGVTYRYTVEAYRADAESVQSDPAWATPNPPSVEAITDLNVETYPTTAAAGSPVGEALVTWTPVARATSYQVFLDGLPYKIVTFDASNPAAINQVTLTELNISQSYTVGVKAANVGGSSSIVSTDFSVEPSEVGPDVIASEPMNVVAIAGNASALVSWDTTVGARTYRVYVDGVLTQQLKGTATALKGLENGREYSVSVAASNFAGDSARSVSVEFVPYEHLPEIVNPNDPDSGLPTLPLSASLEGNDVILNWSAFTGSDLYKVTRDGVELVASSGVGFIDSSTTAGDVYSYQVKAYTAGEVIAVGSVVARIPVAAPANLQAVGLESAAQVTWQAANGAKSYRVYVNSKLVTQTDKTGGVIPGLVNGTTYQVSVSSVNADGESARSASVSVVPVAGVVSPAPVLVAPNAPAGLKGVVADKSVKLSWEASASAAGYRIYRDQQLITQVSGVDYADISVETGEMYSYQVSAFNAAGESPRSIAVRVSTEGQVFDDGSIALPPLAPASVQVAVGDSKATASWLAAPEATAYRVYLDGQLHGQVSSITSYELKGLTNGQSYTLNVASVSKGGMSALSSPATFTPVASDGGTVISIPASPRSLIVAGSFKQFQASWAPSVTATGYRVYYRDLDVKDAPLMLVSQTTATSITIPAPEGAHWSVQVAAFNASGTSAVSAQSAYTAPTVPNNVQAAGLSSTGFKLTWKPSANASDYQVKVNGAPVNVGAAAATIDGLVANTTYQVSVNAANASGRSADSSVVNITTLTAVPTTLTGVDGDKKVTLNWQATPGATAYRLYRDGMLITSTSSLSFVDTGLVNGEVHSYKLSSVSSRGESAKSSAVTVGAINPALKVIPVAPTGVLVTSSGSQLTVTWASVPNALSYIVYVDGLPAQTTGSPGVAFPSNAGSTVKVEVTARNNAGESPRSSASTIVLAPSAPSSPIAYYDTNSIALSWTAPAGATMYKVYRSDLTEPIYQGTVRSFTDSNIVNTNTYYYTITAGNSGGWSEASESTKASPIPAQPTISAVGTPTGVSLSWSSSARAVTNKIYRDGILILTTPATSTSYTDPNAISFQLHSYTVIAVNTAGDSPVSAAAVASRGPAAPAISYTVASDQSASVFWTAVPGVTGYNLYVNGVFNAKVGNVTSGTVTGLTNGTPANVTISWYHSSGAESAQSAVKSVTAVGAPDAPTGLTGTEGAGYVNLSWNAQASTAAQPLIGYHVYRDGTLIRTVRDANTVTILIEDQAAHSYEVAAYGSSGTSVKSTPITLTAAPALIVNGGFENGLTGWTSVGATASEGTWSYRTESKAGLAGTAVYGTTSLTSSLSQTFTLPAEGGTLKFNYGAGVTNTTGDSNTLIIKDNFTGTSIITQLSKGDIRELSVPMYAQVGHSVTVTFSSKRAASSGETHVRIDNVRVEAPTGVMPAPSAPTTVSATPLDGGAKVNWTETGAGGSVTGYNLYFAGALKGTVPVAAGGPVQSTNLSGLTNGVGGVVTVKAYGPGGESTASPASAWVTPVGAPLKPSGAKVTDGAGYVKVAWSGMASTPGNPLTGFYVYRDGALVGTARSDSVYYMDYAAMVGQTYSYEVAAYGPAGVSPKSDVMTGTASAAIIVNGGFESGLDGWTRSGTASIEVNWGYRQGAGSVMVGTSAYASAALTSSLSQTFTVPASGGVLSYDYGTLGYYAQDTGRVVVKDNVTGLSVEHVLPKSNSGAAGQINLTAQAGHSVTVSLTSQRQYSQDSVYARFDNVRIETP